MPTETPAPGTQDAQTRSDARNGRAEQGGDPAPAAAAPDATPEAMPGAMQAKITIEALRFWYGDAEALRGISMEIPANRVTAFIGPSGCGKSTLLRCVNRMNELIPDTRLAGRITVDGQDIYQGDPVVVRRRIGMVFQKPNPFPKTIYQNVIWGARINGYRGDEDELVEQCLRQAALWDEVKDRLPDSAYGLSGGQQQRLCIARALAVRPDVLLMDEPASALDPVATAKLEETIIELKERYTIVVVTHNMQQASRLSDVTAFLYLGELVEMSPTDRLFTRPEHPRTEDYISGRFG